MVRWLYATLIALACIAFAYPACAAPARLNDEIPDAVPDDEGIWSFGYGYQNIALEGPLTSSTTTHSVYKLRYQVSPDANAAVYYQTHSLGGGVGLLSPLFENQDDATATGFDLRLNLLNEPSSVGPGTDGKDTFMAGSAFDIGVGMERMNLTAGALDQSDTLIRAYLDYSTDLSDQMRAHTFFSTGRISGDTHTGSANRVAAGLDYTLNHGGHPLVLMADAILDVYNFRAPTFNTSRITSFDVGMRYGFTDNLYGSLGWMTYNDSENDASGSGVFAGLQWLSGATGGECQVCEPAASAASIPAEAAAAPPAAEPLAVAVIDPNAPEPQVAEQPALVEQPTPQPAAEAPPVGESPPPAPQTQPAPAVVTPPPADDTLVLPDGRADLPVRKRLVSSLQQEFSNPGPPDDATLSATEATGDYNPRSWEDSSDQITSDDASTMDEDNGVAVPELELFPDSVQANAKDVRPRLKRNASSGKAASAVKEKAYPSTDQSVVDVEIISDPPAEDGG